jgi:2-dehydro-3-deoxyphosphooctonate aldolase (KDO 8-P synthase)
MKIELPTFDNELPFVLIGGVNVIESKEIVFQTAETLKHICSDMNIPLVFKASFDKANRSSIQSYRGPGIKEGLEILANLKQKYNVPIITDIHEIWQAKPVSEVADIIQIPAFLCRQTDLLQAACDTKKVLHIKKMQLMAPSEMKNVLVKCHSFGAKDIILCERGTLFGYHNLVVDPLSFEQLKELNCPVSFDITHSLQQPGSQGLNTGGRSQYAENLALMGISQGISSLFIEFHPNPKEAKCDGPCAVPLEEAQELLKKLKALDTLIKSW